MNELEKPTALQKAYSVIRRLERRLDSMREPIAIVGMACRFPGGADTPDAFWKLLAEGRSGIVDVPSERWSAEAFYDPDPSARGRIRTRRGGFLADVASFDAEFFGLSPREATRLDPQQRILLEVAWEALERAGRGDAGSLKESRTGVFVGIGESDFAREYLSGDPESVDVYDGTGGGVCFSAGRLAYFLGLQGPALAVDTACSSSLVAVHLACQSLRRGECDLALAGGVHVMLSPEVAVFLSRAGALAPDGRCKTFDARADGYARAEGGAMVALKALSRARADRDTVLAVIRGSAVNHDGPSSGLTVPNGLAQEKLLRDAVSDAGLPPSAVSYVEAHGTGTELGDPIEVEALARVYGEGRDPRDPFWIGSVKTNFGHLEAAAGIAGLIKVVLALQNRELPPHLHFESPNPRIPWDRLPLKVPTRRIAWEVTESPRRAGVSAFGLSGTNAHAILEEAGDDPSAREATEVSSRHLLVLSAQTPEALRAHARRMARRLEANPHLRVEDVCFTAATGRTHFRNRLSVAGPDLGELGRQLDVWLENAGESSRPEHSRSPRIAFLFTGQGAQYPGMGSGLLRAHPVFRGALKRFGAEVLDALLGRPLLDLFDPSVEPAALAQTAITQPVLVALELALAALWRSWGVVPDIVLGHSVGEIAAASIAGVLEPADALGLAAERGALMQGLPSGGAMLAVESSPALAEEAIEPYGAALAIAAYNSPSSVVLSGDAAALESVAQAFAARGVRSKRLAVSHAFHSPLMEPILKPLEEVAARVTMRRPEIPFIANLSGSLAGDEILSPAYWSRQVSEPVRFSAGVESLRQQGVDVVIEIGPNPTLLHLAQACVPRDPIQWLASLRRGRDDMSTLLRSLGSLYVRGGDVDWREFHAPWQARPVVLPTYPFERRRYWPAKLRRRAKPHESETPLVATSATRHSVLGRRVLTPGRESQFISRVSSRDPRFLSEHRVSGDVVMPGAFYALAALAAGEEIFPEGAQVEGLRIVRSLVLTEDPVELHTVLRPETDGGLRFEVARLAGGSFPQLALGTLRRAERDAVERADIETLRTRASERGDPARFYAVAAERGLQFGPSFRWIDALWMGPGEALARLDPPHRFDAEPMTLQVTRIDSATQVLGAALGDKAVEGVLVPVAVERIRLHRAEEPAGPIWGHAVARDRLSTGLHRGDVSLFSEDGTLLLSMEGVQLQEIRAEAVATASTTRTVPNALYTLEWQHVESPASRQASKESPWLLIDTEGTLATEWAAQWEKLGISTLVQPTVAPGPEGVSLAGIVDLSALGASGADPQRAETLAVEALERAQAVARHPWKAKPRLFWFTRGAQRLGTEKSAVAVSQATLWGLGRTLALEHPGLWGGLVDLDPDDSPVDQAGVAAQALSLDEPQIVVRNQKLRRARIAPLRGAAEAPLDFSPGGTYLLTGGLGDLGRSVASWLIDQGVQYVALLGRSASPALDPELTRLRGSGADVRIFCADVGDRDALGEALERIEREMPPLAGVVHAAGRLDDAALLQQSPSSFRTVFGPKVHGAYLLHELCRPGRPGRPGSMQHFVLFSSAAGVMGSLGQGNYAAANAYLDALAQERARQGNAALSLAWGPWDEIGMAVRAGTAHRLKGIAPFSPERARSLLRDALASARANVIALDADWPKVREVLPARGRALLDSVLDTPKGESKTGGMRDVVAVLRGMPHGRRVDRLQEIVLHRVRKVLEADPSLRIGFDRSFFELGFDSVTALELQQSLEAELGLSLPASVAFEFPTVTALTRMLLEALSLSSPPETSKRSESTSPSSERTADVAALPEAEVIQSLLKGVAADGR